jgi:hypothetical protein
MEVTPTARVNQQCLQKQLKVGRRHRTPRTEMVTMMNGLLGHVAPVYLGTFLDSDGPDLNQLVGRRQFVYGLQATTQPVTKVTRTTPIAQHVATADENGPSQECAGRG